VQNADPGLPSNELNFYDYSKRPPSDLQTVANPITWSADLYPVIVTDGSKDITVENGISWGWTAKSATIGTDSGVFQDPEPAGATVSGVGTSSFSWGDGDPSSLSFSGASFSATPNVPFDLGTITYYNGSNTNDADSVDFDISVNLTNVPEKDFSLDVPLTLINTPNTDDPIASADTVSLGGFGYAFHVEEEQTATVDVYAVLSTGLAGTTAGAGTDSEFSSTDTLGSNPNYSLSIVGLTDPSTGGFVTTLQILGTKSGQTVSDEATIAPFAGVTVNDSTTGLEQTLTVTLSNAANGGLSNLGIGTYDPTAGVYTVTGTVDQVTAALDALVFSPTPDQVAAGQTVTTSFTIADTDSDGASTTDATSSVIAAAAADQPMIAGTVAGQAVSDAATISPFAGLTITDPDASQTETVTVTLSAATNGTLSNLGGGSYDANNGVYTVSGTASVVTAALNGLVFTPTEHQVAPGQTVTTGFVISDTDTAGASASDTTTSVVATAAAVAGFAVFDTTTNEAAPSAVESYAGPVTGLTNEYINITPDSLNISVSTPGWFLHSGGGEDAIVASSGTNVLDGGTGSNFLTGGSGADTFFVDDRGPTADIWSTVNNFHAGDAATIWGVTPQDFNFAWADGQGAGSYTGLTLHATAAGQPIASLTLVGYTTADLTNGRLSISFGTEGGSSTYMYVHANG
jgi:plastocyanin